MNKKAVFYTVSILILTLVILSFTVLTVQQNQKLNENLRDSAALERVNAWHSSVSRDLQQILAYSGIGLNLINNTIEIADYVPSDRGAFVTEMQRYELFVEGQTNEAQLNFSDITNSLPLLIYPGNIIYTHPNGINGNSIEVQPKNAPFLLYDVDIAAGQAINQSSCSSSLVGSGKNISLTIAGTNGSCTFAGTFDPLQNSVLSAKTAGGNNISINLVPPYGNLLITDANSIGINASTKITLAMNSTSINVLYPEPVLFINLGQLEVNRTAEVRLL
jgi:hypothetical protein